MDKNSIIGFVLIGAIMVGWFAFDYKQREKAAIAEMQEQATLAAQQQAEAEATALEQAVAAEVVEVPDSLAVPAPVLVDTTYTLSNDVLSLGFSSIGARLTSAQILPVEGRDYTDWQGNEIDLIKGKSRVNFTLDALSTDQLQFDRDAEASSDSVLVLSAPYQSGRIVEEFHLQKGSYLIKALVRFEGITARSNKVRMEFAVTVPRLEKGYRNEKMYSKVNYAYPDDKDIEDIGGARDQKEPVQSSVSWFAFQQQFFSIIVRSEKTYRSGELSVAYYPENDPDKNLMDCSASMLIDYASRAESYEIPFEMYIGPNHYDTLKSYGQNYERIIPLGGWLVGWFTRFVIIPVFNFLHRFISNFGLIILLMTIFIKLVVLPLAYKSYSSSAKMQVLKPEIDKINAKFPTQEDAMKKQQATMALYKRAGVSPMGGCLPMLIQFPILWAMYRFFPASIELRHQSFLWAKDLSTYDDVLSWGFDILWLDHISLFALLMALSMFFYSKVMTTNQSSGDDPTSKMMRFMSLYMMPVMMFFICNSLSSGLSYYYLLSNLITMLETWIIRRYFVKPDEIMKRLAATEGKPVPKSKWQQRLEEAQNMQRQMEQQKKNGRR